MAVGDTERKAAGPRGEELAADNVSLAYSDGLRTTYALRGVSVTLPPRAFYGIMGPSGSGKSSLLYILSALKEPTEGQAHFGGFAYTAGSRDKVVTRLRRERFGFVFQQPFLLPYLTAIENVLTAAPRGADKAAADRARSLLADLGLGSMENRFPNQLSGGERQRVSVVRAMMNDPDVIFADEPTAALDHENGAHVMEVLARWRTRGTVVVVTHDPEMLTGADRVLHLRDGLLVGDEVRGEN